VQTALNLVTILVSVVLTLVILLQTKGSSFSGAFGGDAGGITGPGAASRRRSFSSPLRPPWCSFSWPW
jgi:protein translocase SecG subunit